MGKIREVFQKMSLKRSLVLLAVFCLSLVSALSVITNLPLLLNSLSFPTLPPS